MKTKRGISLFAIAVVVLVAGLYLAFAPREPSHQGKRLSAWLYDLRGNSSREQAEAAIREMGDRCVPTLLEMLRSRNSRLKVKLMEWAEGHDFSKEALTRLKIVTAEERWS